MHKDTIRLFSPFIPKEASEEVKKTIDSGWLNTGEKAKLFTELLEDKFRFPYLILTNSCTSALRLSLAVAGVGVGDEVITTPWTMEATNTSILEQNAKPVFADIKYETLNIDPKDIEHRITDKTKAIMCVHYAGYPCDLWELHKIAIRNNLVLIEDAAQALGSKFENRYIGNFYKNEFVCFSFQVVKIITCGDGGAVVTDDIFIKHFLETLSWFGINKKDRVSTDLGTFPKDIYNLGYKYNMNDITATFGIESLKYFDEVYKRRQEIAERYIEELSFLGNVHLLDYSQNKTSNYWIFPIHVWARNNFAKYMKKSNIEVSQLYHRNDKWSIFGPIRKDLLNTERTEKNIMHIPIHQDLTNEDVHYIIKTVKKWDNGNL